MSKRYQGGVLGVGFNPLQAPNAPTIGAATAGNTTVSVAFTAPANVGGSAISTYAVRVSPGNVSATGSSSPISVTGLTNDTTYTFSVAALNSYGPSPYSGTVTATPSFLAVEDVFSTWLYTGNGSTQTITNGINLSGQGGLVWLKARNSAQNNFLFDTNRGVQKRLVSNSTAEEFQLTDGLSAFNSNGFTLGSGYTANGSGLNLASWTFREAPKFFDVVTYTGNGVNGRQIAHNLGVTPGFIIYKCTSTATSWLVLHRSLPNGFSDAINLNTTDAAFSLGASFAPTATTFTMSNGVDWNQNGQTYVAYLYAHDATSDGIIQCGSYSGSGSAGNTVTLGWEPQWVMLKASTTTQGWWMYDNMRGMPVGSNDAALSANTTSAEQSYEAIQPTATGFQLMNGNPDTNGVSQTYIYIAIRRGPMKTPTLGTSVFSPVAQAGGGTITTNFPTDLAFVAARNTGTGFGFQDRLRGFARELYSYSTSGEANNSPSGLNLNTSNTSYTDNEYSSGYNFVYESFRRAPSFFDEVCYTGNDANPQTLNHNLGVTPELMIVKQRNTSSPWTVYAASQGLNTGYLNRGDLGFGNNSNWGTAPTSTTFSVQGSSQNASGGTFVAYLFASCPGVSKVGSYTGTGTTQTINCGFTTGARFVLIKRTDSTGDWYVWDSARGIVAGNDPYLLLNDGAAEVTNTDYIDTDNSGFQISSTAPAAINANGGTFIYLAIS